MKYFFYLPANWLRSVPTCLLFSLTVTLCTSIQAQTLTIQGHIDKNGYALPGVQIANNRDKQEVATDAEGKFSLNVISSDTLTLQLKHPDFPTSYYRLSPIKGDSIGYVSFYFDLADKSGFSVLDSIARRGETASPAPGPNQKLLPAFPWPVPSPSAKVVLDTRYFDKINTLAQADTRLKGALQRSGYQELSYYQAPNGFVIACRFEQIDPNGTPKEGMTRWSQKAEPFSKFNLSNYISLLFRAAKGHFRIIVFTVTDLPVEKSRTPPTPEEAKTWGREGADFLPSAIGQLPYTKDYRVTALIYEFEKPENSSARFLAPSSRLAQDDLNNTKITENLAKSLPK